MQIQVVCRLIQKGHPRLLYYQGGEIYTSSFAARDVTWDDWTCVLGWPVQGVWKKFSDDTDVNSAHCCNKKKYLVTKNFAQKK